MTGLEWWLEEEGFTVVNKSYPWMNFSIGELAAIAVEPGLQDCREQGITTIDFVTHSMGGILLRQYLEQNTIAGLGRVVMLAPPNQGSTMADYLLANDLLGPLLPEPAQQLGTGEDSVPLQLGPVEFELGVIAGNNSRALQSPGLENVPNDGTVAVAETRVEGMRDFIVLNVDHSFLMWRSAVLEQVVWFLREGHFDHGTDAAVEVQPQAANAVCGGTAAATRLLVDADQFGNRQGIELAGRRMGVCAHHAANHQVADL